MKSKVIFSKSAAMFGLDARIALAIFGALSVITGAALFSTLENVENTKFINQINEITKAIEGYLLDVRQNLKADSTAYATVGGVNAKNLTENPGESKWKGPYLSFISANERAFKDDNYTYYVYLVKKDVNWTSPAAAKGSICDTSSDCFYAIGIGTLDIDFLKTIDKKIDTTESGSAGKVRYNSDPWLYYITDVPRL